MAVQIKEAWTDAYSPEKISSGYGFSTSKLYLFLNVSHLKTAEFTNRYNMEEENDDANAELPTTPPIAE